MSAGELRLPAPLCLCFWQWFGRWFGRGLLPGLAAGLLVLAPAWAIDNPDAPDLAAAFELRAQPFEARLSEAAGGPGLAQAADAYAAFLETELNRAYQSLLPHLAQAARAKLHQSQRHWLRFRDAEAVFIDGNWVAQDFGNSAALSRADYRAGLVKQRVLSLLAYRQNYPPAQR